MMTHKHKHTHTEPSDSPSIEGCRFEWENTAHRYHACKLLLRLVFSQACKPLILGSQEADQPSTLLVVCLCPPTLCTAQHSSQSDMPRIHIW
eukprot:m.15650 g.15650  ORF g.15650 m.15650 type:complete len:92 (+) comp10493_c0_seq1:37-312(+)